MPLRKFFDLCVLSVLLVPRQHHTHQVEETLVFTFLEFSSISDGGRTLSPPSCGLWFWLTPAPESFLSHVKHPDLD